MATKRKFGPFDVAPVGLGCMNLSHGYGLPTDAREARRLLHAALDHGYDMLDTATLYGFGANETLLGDALIDRRNDYVLASKCVLFGNNGKRGLDGRPDVIKAQCEESLRRLQTDVIDVYYLHRLDPNVPIEDSMGAMKDLVNAGKIRAIGLSEMSADTLRRAHKVHPVAAIQNEYSLWSRNAEIAVLDACLELDVALVAFSPVTRGFLTGCVRNMADLPDNDLRHTMPRFQSPHFDKNLQLLSKFENFARECGYSPATLCLGWLLAQGDHVITIPGTTREDHMMENFDAGDVSLSDDIIATLDQLINRETVSGPRYNAAAQADSDMEEFA